MPAPQAEERVLIVAPVGQDAVAMAAMLEAQGIAVFVCSTLAECPGQLSTGAGAVLLAEEALELPGFSGLFEVLKAQPPWSELPLIILTRGGESRMAALLDLAPGAAGSVTLLERPMRPATLLRSVQVALRSRRRQYQVRDLLAEQQRQKEELNTVLETLPAGVIIADAQGRIVRGNAATRELWGAHPETGSWADYGKWAGWWPESEQPIQARESAMTRALEHGEVTRNELILCQRFGGAERRYYLNNVAPLRDADGRIVGGVAAMLDVTEQKRAEEALRASEKTARQQLAELEGIYRAAPVGLCVFDRELRYRRINQRLAEINGLPVEAHIGRTVHEVAPSLGKQAEDVIRWVIESGKPVRVEFKGQTAAQPGVERVWNEHWFPLGEGGQIEEVGVVVVDITERKAFQEELERMVAERTAKLHELVGELEHFSYTITHDMRAPLRAIRGFAEAIEEICSARPNPELAGLVRRMQQGAERMDLLITDALQYTKAVRQELPLAPVDLGALLRGMLDTYPEFISADIRLQEPILSVMGNEAGLTQCFSNLLGNALKFARPGVSPRVRVWSERRHVPPPGSAETNAPEQREWVRVWVEDNGIGISQAMRSKLFLMFSRDSRNYEGTGIGLALVRKVVQRMGGRVGVESEEGKGSRFWMELRPGGR